MPLPPPLALPDAVRPRRSPLHGTRSPLRRATGSSSASGAGARTLGEEEGREQLRQAAREGGVLSGGSRGGARGVLLEAYLRSSTGRASVGSSVGSSAGSVSGSSDASNLGSMSGSGAGSSPGSSPGSSDVGGGRGGAHAVPDLRDVLAGELGAVLPGGGGALGAVPRQLAVAPTTSSSSEYLTFNLSLTGACVEGLGQLGPG